MPHLLLFSGQISGKENMHDGLARKTKTIKAHAEVFYIRNSFLSYTVKDFAITPSRAAGTQESPQLAVI